MAGRAQEPARLRTLRRRPPWVPAVSSRGSHAEGNEHLGCDPSWLESHADPRRAREVRGALRELPHEASRGAGGVMKTRDQQNSAWRKWYRSNAARKIAWQHRRREELRQWW